MKDTERRSFVVKELRVKRDEGKPPRITGYAAVFNSRSQDLGGFVEYVKPGAFKRSLAAGADVRALFNHDPNFVLGRTASGTLKLAEDDNGLMIDCEPPDAQWARDLMTSIDRGDIDQMSFGFRCMADDWRTEDGKPCRDLLDVDLLDVSPVTFPAYEETSVAVRSLNNWKQQQSPAADLLAAARMRQLAASIK